MMTNELNIIPLAIVERPLTIGEMVVEDYRKADVFRSFGLDYCCGGKKSLQEACAKKGIDVQAVQQALEAIDLMSSAHELDDDSWEPDELAEHIVNRHHRYVDNALPVLRELTAKVARVHGEKHPELLEIAFHFNAVAQELQLHMHKEEQILFPYIRKMAAAGRDNSAMPFPVFGTVENPVRMMEAEHENAGEIMAEIRRLSDDFRAPAEACTSYRVLFAKLHEFEQDLHRHIHLENNILFPKSIEMEKLARTNTAV